MGVTRPKLMLRQVNDALDLLTEHFSNEYKILYTSQARSNKPFAELEIEHNNRIYKIFPTNNSILLKSIKKQIQAYEHYAIILPVKKNKFFFGEETPIDKKAGNRFAACKLVKEYQSRLDEMLLVNSLRHEAEVYLTQGVISQYIDLKNEHLVHERFLCHIDFENNQQATIIDNKEAFPLQYNLAITPISIDFFNIKTGLLQVTNPETRIIEKKKENQEKLDILFRAKPKQGELPFS